MKKQENYYKDKDTDVLADIGSKIPETLCDKIPEISGLKGRYLRSISNDILIKVGKSVNRFYKESPDDILKKTAYSLYQECRVEYNKRKAAQVVVE